jgi:3D (Asp-Asp-Asp) domain-containing protein
MNPLIALVGVFLLSASASASPVAAPVAAVETPSYEVKLTAYNAVASQTDNDPSVTASGAISNPEIIAARSRDLAEELPFGTIISIEASATSSPKCGLGAVSPLVGYRVIADTMNSRMNKQIDVLLNENDTVSHEGVATNPSLVLGVCAGVTVHVVGHVDLKDIPKTQADLARIVSGKTAALAVR